jgi:hypothetical protein
MPTQDSKAQEARSAQSAHSKRATLDLLRSKKRLEKEVTILLPVEGGKTEEVSFLFQSIGAQEWDRLVAKHPPTAEQRVEGNAFNMHTFAPALLSRVCVDPELTEEEWKEIWNSPDWNRGEVIQFYVTAVELCSTGMDIPFSGRD